MDVVGNEGFSCRRPRLLMSRAANNNEWKEGMRFPPGYCFHKEYGAVFYYPQISFATTLSHSR